MDYGRAGLADRLACEYVAGTLRGGARRRFESLLLAHAGLRQTTRLWEARLMPLTMSVPPEAPHGRVWQRIQGRIEGLGKRPASRNTSPLGRLSLWRGIAAFTTFASVVLGAVLVLQLTAAPPAQPPVIVVLSTTGEPAGGAAPASFVASISGDGRMLVTQPLVSVRVQADHALELWAIPAGGAPRSLGLISATGTTVVQRSRSLAGAASLAVSLEPPGGSPSGAPTGPVLWAGKLTL